MTPAEKIYSDALSLMSNLPERKVSEATMDIYMSTMRRMMNDDVVDPLRPDDARDSYYVRRAALHFCTRLLLKKNLDRLIAASESNDEDEANRLLTILREIVERCGPAITRDPPRKPGKSSFDGSDSRWTALEGPRPRRGKRSKKHVLATLPKDWTDRVWQTAVQIEFRYLDALAVHIVTPARPSEFVPSSRDGRPVPGIEIELAGEVLVIRVTPTKSHDGKYGTGQTAVRLDAKSDYAPVAHLVRLCRAKGGSTVVSLTNTNTLRKALKRLGHRALGDAVTVTGYLFRHQYIADLKSTVGAGVVVASAAGHCSDRTQARYGRVEHGRRRTEFIEAVAKRSPGVGNIERLRRFDEPNPSSIPPPSL